MNLHILEVVSALLKNPDGQVFLNVRFILSPLRFILSNEFSQGLLTSLSNVEGRFFILCQSEKLLDFWVVIAQVQVLYFQIVDKRSPRWDSFDLEHASYREDLILDLVVLIIELIHSLRNVLH